MPSGTSVKQPVYVVDAFAERPFVGNPAAVCPLKEPVSTAWMRRIAAEMNLSETAFVHPRSDGWGLRWFTPTVEVNLCGHATLATAHVLAELGHWLANAPLVFHTRSGQLSVDVDAGGYRLDFPSLPVRQTAAPSGFAEAIGAVPVWCGTNGMDLFAELEDESSVRGLKPDFTRLGLFAVRGVIVTAAAADFDFVSRFFAPASGIAEDPVTGSAHCALGPYWSKKLGRTDLIGYQASARGGTVWASVRGDRVVLGGKAVTVLRGELEVPADSTPEEWPLTPIG
jgi:PhzF family phenazine biosynthesis protein